MFLFSHFNTIHRINNNIMLMNATRHRRQHMEEIADSIPSDTINNYISNINDTGMDPSTYSQCSEFLLWAIVFISILLIAGFVMSAFSDETNESN